MRFVIYIYIYIYREREREREELVCSSHVDEVGFIHYGYVGLSLDL